MYYSRLMLYILGSILLSVWCAEWFRVPAPALIGGVIGGCVFLIRSIIVRAFCLLCAGIVLMNGLYYQQVDEYAFRGELNGAQMFEGVVVSEPREHERGVVVKVQTRSNVRIRVVSAVPVLYGDMLRFECDVRAPEMIEHFDYPKYLIKERVHAACSSRSVEILARDQGNAVYAALMRFKAGVRERIQRVLPPAHASLAAGLVIGGTVGMPPAMVEAFQKTGTTHIVAVSGSNFALVVGLVVALLTMVQVGRTGQFVIASVVIVMFALITGIEAAIVRAACMGWLVVAARACGAYVNARNLLLGAATLMVAANPLVLRYDVGFQLSFAATVGLLYGMRIVSLMQLSKRQQWMVAFIAPSLVAYCATLPVLLYNFGALSLSAPLINLLIAPCIAFGMLSAVWSLGVEVLPWFGEVLRFVAWLPLEIIVRLVRWGASWEMSYYENLFITQWQMILWVISYSLLYYSIRWVVKRNEQS